MHASSLKRRLWHRWLDADRTRDVTARVEYKGFHIGATRARTVYKKNKDTRTTGVGTTLATLVHLHPIRFCFLSFPFLCGLALFSFDDLDVKGEGEDRSDSGELIQFWRWLSVARSKGDLGY